MVIAPSFDSLNTSAASRLSVGTSLHRTIKKTFISLAMLCSLLGASASLMADETVNINSDSAEVLSAGLQGVGLAKAYRIVEYRQAFGPFESIDELAEVKGIGEKIIEDNRSQITLD